MGGGADRRADRRAEPDRRGDAGQKAAAGRSAAASRGAAPGRAHGMGARERAIADVGIGDDVIRLGQLLKLAGMVDAGSDAKAVLAEGAVTVNGEPEHRRGRQLRDGDVVRCHDRAVRVRREA